MPQGVFEKLKGEIRTCPSCGADFTPKQPAQLYCCPTHKNRAKLQRAIAGKVESRIEALERRVATLERDTQRRRN